MSASGQPPKIRRQYHNLDYEIDAGPNDSVKLFYSEDFRWHKSLVIDSIERMGSVSAEELYCILVCSDIPLDSSQTSEGGQEKIRTKTMMCGGVV